MTIGGASPKYGASMALLGLLAGTPTWAIAVTSTPRVNVAPYQVTIWWDTDVSGTTEVHYGLTSAATPAAYPNHSVHAVLAGTRHSRTLVNLPPGTYYFRV